MAQPRSSLRNIQLAEVVVAPALQLTLRISGAARQESGRDLDEIAFDEARCLLKLVVSKAANRTRGLDRTSTLGRRRDRREDTARGDGCIAGRSPTGDGSAARECASMLLLHRDLIKESGGWAVDAVGTVAPTRERTIDCDGAGISGANRHINERSAGRVGDTVFVGSPAGESPVVAHGASVCLCHRQFGDAARLHRRNKSCEVSPAGHLSISLHCAAEFPRRNDVGERAGGRRTRLTWLRAPALERLIAPNTAGEHAADRNVGPCARLLGVAASNAGDEYADSDGDYRAPCLLHPRLLARAVAAARARGSGATVVDIGIARKHEVSAQESRPAFSVG